MSQRQDEELIQALFDHSISETEFEQLEGRLLDDDAFRSLFHEYARLNNVLTEEFEGRAMVSQPQLRALADPPNVRPQFIQSLLSAAAIIAALLVAAYFITVSVNRPGPITRVDFGPETSAQIVHAEAGAPPSELHQSSVLTIDRGTVALTLPSGVKALVEGPAQVVGQGENSLQLLSGRAWFDVPTNAIGFTCSTPTLEIVDLGTRFGVVAEQELPQSVHVLDGKIRVTPHGHPDLVQELTEGQGLVWTGKEFETAKDNPAFLSSHPRRSEILIDDFSEADGTPMHGKSPDRGAGPWEVVEGSPVINQQTLDTSGHAKRLFAPLGFPRLDDLNHVLLLTIQTETPDNQTFHSEGWAGVSLHTGDQERIFVGDPGGLGGSEGRSWAIHPVGGQAVAPSPPLMGKRIVTLRYDYRTGLAELFEGNNTNGKALASEWISPNLEFDRLRISNGNGGDIALKLVSVYILTTE